MSIINPIQQAAEAVIEVDNTAPALVTVVGGGPRGPVGAQGPVGNLSTAIPSPNNGDTIEWSGAWFSRPREGRTLESFGTVPSSGGDWATLMQAAAVSGEGRILVPTGTLNTSAPWDNATGQTQIIRGRGRQRTIIVPQGNFDAIRLNKDHDKVEDLTVRGPLTGAPTAGAGIVLVAGGFQSVRDVRLSSLWNGFRADNAFNFTCDSWYCVNNYNYGMYIQDIAAVDRGDQCFVNLTFDNVATTLTAASAVGSQQFTVSTSQAASISPGQHVVVGTSIFAETVTVATGGVNTTTGVITTNETFVNPHPIGDAVKRGLACIRHESGGGVKMTNSKLLNHARGYDLAIADGSSTSVMVLNGNSYESQSDVSIQFSCKGPNNTGTYQYMNITGGEMSVQGDGIRFAYGIQNVKVGGGLVMHGNGTGTAIDMVAGNSYGISDILLYSWVTGVRVGSSVFNVQIDPSVMFRTVTYDIRDYTTVGNQNTSNRIYRQRSRQVYNITSPTTYTPLFEVGMNASRAFFCKAVVEGALTGATTGNDTVLLQSTYICRVAADGVTVTVDRVEGAGAGGTSAGPLVDIVTNTGAVAGAVRFGLKLSTQGYSGGTPRFDGTMSISIDGSANYVMLP